VVPDAPGLPDGAFDLSGVVVVAAIGFSPDEVAVVLVLPGIAPAPAFVGGPDSEPDVNPGSCVPMIFGVTMHNRIQKAATPIVIRVNRSPALAPNALWPPMPPSAPASPPPRPRCSKMIRIKKQAVKNNNKPRRKLHMVGPSVVSR